MKLNKPIELSHGGEIILYLVEKLDCTEKLLASMLKVTFSTFMTWKNKNIDVLKLKHASRRLLRLYMVVDYIGYYYPEAEFFTFVRLSIDVNDARTIMDLIYDDVDDQALQDGCDKVLTRWLPEFY